MGALINDHKPKKLSEVQGQDSALAELKKYVEHYRPGSKALLLYGPSGNGKTCAVHALANELGREIVEVNASDVRNKESIHALLGSAIKQHSLFFKGKIILVDEIDGVSGQEDRGGVSAIAELIQESGFPIVMTANDPFDKKFAPIRKKAELLEFHALNYLSIYNVLKSIAKKEKIEYDDEALKCLARSVGGDLRAAINDLQTLSNEKRLTKEDLASLSEREQRESIMQALLKVFKTTDPNIAKYAYKDIAEDLDELFMWVDENLPKEYLKPEDLSKAMSNLALADVYKGRIRRWQYYRFYVYCYDLLSVGIALSKDEKYKHFVNYTPTTRILKMWQANMKNMKKKAIAEKIASGTHTSTKRAMRDTIPYLQVLFKRGFRESKAIAEEYDLSKEEVEWLRK